MPGKIKVKVLAGRNLPVMDRASDTTDAFVEIKFGSVTHKTDVCRKSLNPHWSSTEWYRFEVDESELQDEPLQLRLMDHDTYSANDAIGKVVISLAPLLAREANNLKGVGGTAGGAVLSGWIPVFDTMHGIRGELNVIVKVELFSDFNKYKTSSCGVQFFHCPTIPPGYRPITIHGFVEELVVNDDPEYQWIDKIRTPRASNEARQVAFIKLSNQVQRLVGVKAAELGANAVVGYQQDFDLEGEAGVVARATGTAVSIASLPTLNQSMTIPPCTQQQLKKYLDILATDNESITDLNQYFQSHQEELQKFLSILNPKTPSLLDDSENIDEDEKSPDRTRQSSVKSYGGSLSIYQDNYASQKSLRHISEDQTDLNKLLKGKDDSDSDSSGPLQKIIKLKTNFFAKRFGSNRSRKSDKQDDQISIKSNSSDSSRLSLTDIKNEFKKFKRLKKPKFRKAFVNKEDEGVGMASILARSVIHAHTSLACIAETQDSEHSPSSTMRRTSESEPTINLSDDDRTRNINVDATGTNKANISDTKRVVPEIHTSLKNINSEEADQHGRQRKLSESCPTTPMTIRSDNLLKLPGEAGYFGSLSISGDSSEVYSSSDEDDESSDQKTDTEKSVETTSSVVQSVLNKEVDRVVITQMDRKLSILTSASTEPSELKHVDDSGQSINPKQEKDSGQPIDLKHKDDSNEHRIMNIGSSESFSSEDTTDNDDNAPNDASTATDKNPQPCVATKSNTSLHFKFHNPFSHRKVSKCISAPSSPVEKHGFVYRSSVRIKQQLSKLSKNSMIKSISHYSLRPKKKHLEVQGSLSQPGSTSDVPSKVPSETVLGSPFLSYADLLSLDKDRADTYKPLYKPAEVGESKVTMYIGSEPVSRASLSGPSYFYHKDEGHNSGRRSFKGEKSEVRPSGIIHTAMETILIDKVQSLLVPASPEPAQSKETHFFDNVNKKQERVEEVRNLHEAHMSEMQTLHVSDVPRQKNKKGSLVHTAMETILMDKVQSLMMPATPDAALSKEQKFFDDVNVKLEAVEKARNDEEHIKNDIQREELTKDLSKPKETLIQTAMKTILFDKAQTLIPPSSKLLHYEDRLVSDVAHQIPRTVEENVSKGGSLLHSAMETILLDKVQAFIPASSEPIAHKNIHCDSVTNNMQKQDAKDDQSSLFHSAMETILMDKVQSLIPPSSEPIPSNKETDNANIHPYKQHHSSSYSEKQKESKDDNVSLLHSAMETILMDKVQSLIPPSSEPIPSDKQTDNANIHPDKQHHSCSYSEKQKESKEDNVSLLHSAMETILMEKVQALTPGSSEPLVLNKPCDSVSINQDSASLKSESKKEPSNDNRGLLNSAMETILIDKVQSLIPASSEPLPLNSKFDNGSIIKIPQGVYGKKNSSASLLHSAMETMLIDNVQSMLLPSKEPLHTSSADNVDQKSEISNKCVDDDIIENAPNKANECAVKTMLLDKFKPPVISTADASEFDKGSRDILEEPKAELTCSTNGKKENKLVRQDSVHSLVAPDDNSRKMSKEISSNIVISCKLIHSKPVLQHFHPILSGTPLETIPSMPENSLDHTESLDIEGVGRTCDCQPECKSPECGSDTNSASVCDNSHAACRFDRSEGDRDEIFEKEIGSPRHARHESYGGRELGVMTPQAHSTSLIMPSTPMGIHRRSSDSDLSVTPKGGGSLNTSAGNVGSGGAILRPSMNSNNLDMLEYPFLTMTEYPPGLILHLGGTVCSRSVKLVDGGGESAVHAAWWAELRTELRAHARALRCNAVLAYSESTAICEDVCVLSASGTAAVINLDCEFSESSESPLTVTNGTKNGADEVDTETCSIAHVPYSPGTGPVRAELAICSICRKARVPAVLLATCGKPPKLACFPKAVTLTAVAARVRRAPPASEPGARDISDQLPFLEYELHKLLLAKLRMQGANALFSLQTQIAVGERCVMALATGTAVRVNALPPPTPPRIKATENEKDALEIQRALWDSFTANKAANGYDTGPAEISANTSMFEVEVEEPSATLDLCFEKDACVLELDEAEDVETAKTLATRRIHMQVYTSGVKAAPAATPQAFAQVWRARLMVSGQPGGASGAGERHVARALDGVTYKLRRLQPCALVAPRFQLELPEDEIQLILSGTAIPLVDPSKVDHSTSAERSSSQASGNSLSFSTEDPVDDEDDDIFTLDEEQDVKPSQLTELAEDKSAANGQTPTTVSLTSLSYVSGSQSARRVCALRLLFVRETTAVRELGGLSGFLHTFTCEVLAIVRAYTAALGGNALTSFYIKQLMLQDNAHKNQGQCLLSVGGDVVNVSF